MALLPSESDLTSSTTTNAQQKINFAGLRNFLADLLGTDSSNKNAARAALGVPPRAVRIDVASVAGVVDLTTNAPATDDIRITGALAITGFTIAAGRVVRVTANGAFTLTNSANIVTQTGANIVAATGDTFMLRATAADTVEILGYTRAASTTSGRLIGYQVITADGSYVKGTNNPSFIVVEAQGGGGGGGGSAVTGSAAGGGGAGGYGMKRILASALSASETLTIGAGGTAGVVGGTGGTGGTTAFGTLLTCTGGGGGGGASVVASFAGGAGGTSTGGDLNCRGAVGGRSSVNSVTNGVTASGEGAASRFGGNGASVANGSDQQGGSAAANSGAGGGGSSTNAAGQTGGVGGSGLIIIWEYS